MKSLWNDCVALVASASWNGNDVEMDYILHCELGTIVERQGRREKGHCEARESRLFLDQWEWTGVILSEKACTAYVQSCLNVWFIQQYVVLVGCRKEFSEEDQEERENKGIIWKNYCDYAIVLQKHMRTIESYVVDGSFLVTFEDN